MRYALESGILCFNVESGAECWAGSRPSPPGWADAPRSALRVNPDVDAGTHPYISTGLKENKFGVEFDDAPALYRAASRMPQIEVVGIDCHIGSQPDRNRAIPRSAGQDARAGRRHRAARASRLRHLDLGGGLGIRYRDESPPDAAVYLNALFAARRRPRAETPVRAGSQPGRQRRRAAHPHRIPETRRGAQFRRRRCGHERPDPPRPVRGLARHRPGRPQRRTRRASTTWSGRSAKPATSSATNANWRLRGRRPAGGNVGRRLRHVHEFQLQQRAPRAAEVMVDGGNDATDPGARDAPRAFLRWSIFCARLRDLYPDPARAPPDNALRDHVSNPRAAACRGRLALWSSRGLSLAFRGGERTRPAAKPARATPVIPVLGCGGRAADGPLSSHSRHRQRRSLFHRSP